MRSRLLARILLGLSVGLAVVAAVFLVLARTTPQPSGSFGFRGFAIVFALTFGTIGPLIAARHPGNPIGWIFCAMGIASGFQEAASQYAIYALLHNPGAHLPLGEFAAWIPSWIWIPATSGAAFLLLLFPDGRLPSPRWRVVVVLEIAGTAVAASGAALLPGPLENFSVIANPYPAGSHGLMLGLSTAGQLVYGLGIIAAAASLVVRFRRSRGDERQQLKWLATAGAILAVTLFTSLVGTSGPGSAVKAASVPAWLSLLVIVGFGSVPVATGIAILKYRLYEIDVVINKAVVYGTLAGFITLLYVGIVVGAGSLLGRGGRHNTALAIAATAAVALAFQPARDRVQLFANRLVYGSRATPYEVMAGFAHRVAGTLSTDDLLPEMAEASARGVGATGSRIRLYLPAGGERAVTWPADAEWNGSDSHRTEVSYHGTPIGEILVEKPQLTPAEDKLLKDLASQAGLAMHNVRLTEELATRLEELAVQSAALQVSRQRLVAARDVQRRGLERDIREGPQRQLLDIGRRIGESGQLAESDPAAAEQILDQLGAQATSTLEDLRDLARGIFPPLLAEKGVVAAVDAHIRKVGANATIAAHPEFTNQRYDVDTEAALYFISLQALQNVSRHADGAAAIVRLNRESDTLLLQIADDGPGFDVDRTPAGMGIQIMQDRVDALDGSLAIERGVNGGTTVSCRIPAGALVTGAPS